MRGTLPNMAEKQIHQTDCVLIKSYAGRRLYDTVSSTYVSLDDLANMVLNRERFIVLDAQTGNDITREILNRRD